MKLKLFFLLSTILLILVACGNGTESFVSNLEDSEGNNGTTSEDSNDNSLLDLSETEPGWINYEGNLGKNTDYLASEPINYNSQKEYMVNRNVYISYFNGNEFIKTVQQSPNEPIEQVEQADNIRVSFHNSYEDTIYLREE